MANENILPGSYKYNLDGGILYVKAEGDTTWLHLGNIVEGGINETVEGLIHELTASGIRLEDRESNTKIMAGGTFVLDVISLENLKMFFFASTATAMNQASGTLSAVEVDITEGRWSDLGKRDITSITGVTNEVGAVTYVENEDFVIDYKNGLIAMISGGDITDQDTILVTAPYGAQSRTKISAGEVKSMKRHFRWEGNPSEGQDQTIQGYINIKPTGDYSLIGTEWKKMSFEFKFQLHSNYNDLFEVINNG